MKGSGARGLLALRRAAGAAHGHRRARITLDGADALDGADERAVCVIYGNCQADALRVLLDSSPRFAEVYRTIQVPAIHEITRESLPTVQASVAQASLFVTQLARNGYHGLPVGSQQMAALARKGCRVVSIVALY